MRYAAPRRSALPPSRGEPVVGGRPIPRRPLARHAERQVFVLFGAPGSGVSTIARIAHEESAARTQLLGWSARAAAEDADVDVVFVDAEGQLATAEDVQGLYDTRLVSPAGGALVRVERGGVRDAEFDRRHAVVDAYARLLALPYLVVRNDDLENAVLNLLLLAGITE